MSATPVLRPIIRKTMLGTHLPVTVNTWWCCGAAATTFIHYEIPFDGVITSWATEFTDVLDAAGNYRMITGVQLRVFRPVSPTATNVTVTKAGTLHDPAPILQQRFGASYPAAVMPVDSAIEWFDRLSVEKGDWVGVAVWSGPNGFDYPCFGTAITKSIARDVALGETIDFATERYLGIELPPEPVLQVNVASALHVDLKLCDPPRLPSPPIQIRRSTISVAILGDAHFDPRMVLPDSIELQGVHVQLLPHGGYNCVSKNVNNDRFPDLVCAFEIEALKESPWYERHFAERKDKMVAVLRGVTTEGYEIIGEILISLEN